MNTSAFHRFKFSTNIYIATLYQISIAVLILGLTRLFFYTFNRDLFTIPDGEWDLALLGGAVFDIAALLHLNLIFIIMRIMPFNFVHKRGYMLTTNIIYIAFNSFAIIANISDTIFYRFTNTRTRMVALTDFLTDDNATGILFTHIGTYWYMTLVAAAFILLMILIAFRVKIRELKIPIRLHQIIVKVVTIPLFAAIVIIGIRNGIHRGKPLSLADAIRYTTVNNNINIILNTPYTIIRTIGKEPDLIRRNYLPNDEATNLIRPLYNENAHSSLNKKNIVIIILEGIGASFYQHLKIPNRGADKSPNLMTFTDSLSEKSYICTNAYTTGRRSIEGISAILGGFPTFSPFIFMYSQYNSHKIDALPKLLNKEGYKSTFYCGCNKGSYSFETFAKAMGYNRFIGRKEYGDDSHYDGAWGIYDDKMARFILDDLSRTKPPFIASWFTITSHSPYTIPEEYRPLCRSTEGTMDNTVEYVNIVLRNFFNQASREAWYHNTLFVITSDHGSMMDDEIYNNANTLYRVPVIFYTPDGSLQPFREERALSHIDITPSILGLIGYPERYISVGQDIFDTERNHFAVSFVNDLYQIVEGDYILQFDPITDRSVALFNKTEDPILSKNLINTSDKGGTKNPAEERSAMMEKMLKAFLQEYTNRLIDNKLSI